MAGSLLLMVGFVIAPRLLAPLGAMTGFAGSGELAHAAQAGFLAYWQSGDAEAPAALSAVIDYWQRYHVVKALFALLLAAVLILVATRAWRGLARAGSVPRRLGAGLAAVAASMGGLFAVALVMANVQGAVAPFASLLPMIAAGSGPELTAVTDQARAALDGAGPADGPPVLAAMVDAVADFHVVLAVLAALVTLVLVVGSVVLWRRRRSADRPARLVLAWLSVAGISVAMLFAVLTLANATTAARPGAALLALLAGSW